jgi:hypothetical protein
MYGYNSPADAICPEPGRTSPEARADWHTAFAAVGQIEGIDLRGCSDGQLHLYRAAYQQETSWAPPYVAEDLRLARLQQRTAYENHIREQHEIRAAADIEATSRHQSLAEAWNDMRETAASLVNQLAQADQTRRRWETLTEPSRQMALAANRELRRRRPDKVLTPPGLVEASPSQGQRDEECHQVPAIVSDQAWEDLIVRVAAMTEQARAAEAKLKALRGIRSSAANPGALHVVSAGQVFPNPRRDAIVQPARPYITPASQIVRHFEEGRRVDGAPEAQSA